MHETPLLVDVSKGSFDDYIKSLSKSAKKNYNYTKKNNQDLIYSNIAYDPGLIAQFMDLWEEQEISGEKRKWGISKGFVDYLYRNNMLLCYGAYKSEDQNKFLSVHFIEIHGSLAICHPPMFDKSKYNDRYLAKYMWFNLIEHCLTNRDIHWLDLGGGNRGSWKDLITNRTDSYKWLYVPKDIKEKPEEQLPYVITTNPFLYKKRLRTATGRLRLFNNKLTDLYVKWVWYNKKRRISKIFNKIMKS